MFGRWYYTGARVAFAICNCSQRRGRLPTIMPEASKNLFIFQTEGTDFHWPAAAKYRTAVFFLSIDVNSHVLITAIYVLPGFHPDRVLLSVPCNIIGLDGFDRLQRPASRERLYRYRHRCCQDSAQHDCGGFCHSFSFHIPYPLSGFQSELQKNFIYLLYSCLCRLQLSVRESFFTKPWIKF